LLKEWKKIGVGVLIVMLASCLARGQEAPLLPRFVSLASSKVHVRVGPDKTYRVAWEFKRRSIPVEVILEYDSWRKIRDYEGAQGWVHKSMLTGVRHVIFLRGRHPMVDRPKEDGQIRAYIEGDVIARLKTYNEKWCEVETEGITGWVSRQSIWGLHPHEERSPKKCFLGLSFLCRKAATK
jgi:SH3-like domain-containing protein